ncbi:linear amide C-N hydrolase [Fulvivirga kasyanovii]|uniref:Linear amide C-N hydrolase n=1 Tax=Fulvivirga kasyanovii TaxID=396812 RepID=A0ABW9RKT0_9BACT|nr:linear amide C-N hydrolase [Fulvivirga kasyanovii]MTI24684.1 linear amide C-N hydrolase [Fulvivirga kasyanovii]
MKKILLNTLLVCLLSLTSYRGYSCTTFCIKDTNHLVMGKNFDFFTGVGQVVINKRNVRKLSFPMPSEKQLEWSSKYGSITFNQMGREFPYGGINEKGLVVEIMWMEDTVYPEIDERYGLADLQWIQYQLDNAATVAEVLASDKLVRISKIPAVPIHFMVCDAKGNIATVEYIDGKMVYHTQSSLPVCVLTNDRYDLSHNYLTSLSDPEEYQFTVSSFDRFAEASLMVSNFKDQEVIDYSFDILSAVSNEYITLWSIVYDIKNMTIHYKTRNNPDVRTLKVADFDFSCNSPSSYIDIDHKENATSAFHTYAYEKNLEVMNTALNVLSKRPEFHGILPSEEERKLLARYPDSTTCN